LGEKLKRSPIVNQKAKEKSSLWIATKEILLRVSQLKKEHHPKEGIGRSLSGEKKKRREKPFGSGGPSGTPARLIVERGRPIKERGKPRGRVPERQIGRVRHETGKGGKRRRKKKNQRKGKSPGSSKGGFDKKPFWKVAKRPKKKLVAFPDAKQLTSHGEKGAICKKGKVHERREKILERLQSCLQPPGPPKRGKRGENFGGKKSESLGKEVQRNFCWLESQCKGFERSRKKREQQKK